MKMSVKDSVIYLDEGKLEVFTPQEYIGSIAKIDGEEVDTFGATVYKYYKNPTDKKPTKVGALNIPSMVKFYPLYIDQNVKDTIWDGVYNDLNENEYTRMTFDAGARVMKQYTEKKLDNTVSFIDMLIGRKLDNNIPYTLLSNLFAKNSLMNGFSLNVSIPVFDLIIYKICRDKKDLSKPFAHVIGKNPKVSPVAYQYVNIRDICSADSVFSALAFEDMNNMLDASLNMTKTEKAQNISPVEQIIKF